LKIANFGLQIANLLNNFEKISNLQYMSN